MTANTPRRWFDNNFAVAVATIVIAVLALTFSVIAGEVELYHLLLGCAVFVALVSVGACLFLANKFERVYEGFSSYLKNQKVEDELKNRVEAWKEKLANVEWLIKKEEFQEFEDSEETDEVWVLAFDFRYELYDFKEIVISNLKKKKRYVYIYPRDARNRLHHFKGILDEAEIPEETINECIEFFELDKRIVPLNEAIYNPRSKKRTRAILMTPEIEFEYYIELNPEQTSRMIEKFQSLMGDGQKMTLSQILTGKGH